MTFLAFLLIPLCTVHGNSMLPEIRPGAVIFCEYGQPFASVKAGDRCVYKEPGTGRRLIHVALRQHGRGWTMGGINNFAVDAYEMDASNFIAIIGKVENPK